MDTPTQAPTPVPQQAAHSSNWSWGGFVYDPVIILATRNYMMLFFYLLAFIPLVNILFWIAFKIYMGMNTHRLVNESAGFANQDERNGFLRGLDHAGWIMFMVMLVGIAIGFILFMTIGLALFKAGVSGNDYPRERVMRYYR